MEKIIEEIIDLVNEQRDSQGQISLDKLKTDIGILIIEQSKVNNGVLDGVNRSKKQNERMRKWFEERTGLKDALLIEHMERIDEMLNVV
jgi:hypothetical protein